jgi:hypothetical protein
MGRSPVAQGLIRWEVSSSLAHMCANPLVRAPREGFEPPTPDPKPSASLKTDAYRLRWRRSGRLDDKIERSSAR